jgi:dethiobiotin synthetase
MKRVFVSGISTGVGKTVVSAGLVNLWGAHYWKPVQSGTESEGDLDDSPATDSEVISRLTRCKVIPEAYALKAPLSPHAAAELESLSINLDTINLPPVDGPFVVEGAGGLLVPLNERELQVDLIKKFNLPVVLVSRHYLGSINHTLLSLEALQSRGIPLYGVVFVGEENEATERVILARVDVQCVRIPIFKRINTTTVATISEHFERAGF